MGIMKRGLLFAIVCWFSCGLSTVPTMSREGLSVRRLIGSGDARDKQ